MISVGASMSNGNGVDVAAVLPLLMLMPSAVRPFTAFCEGDGECHIAVGGAIGIAADCGVGARGVGRCAAGRRGNFWGFRLLWERWFGHGNWADQPVAIDVHLEAQFCVGHLIGLDPPHFFEQAFAVEFGNPRPFAVPVNALVFVVACVGGEMLGLAQLFG